MHMQREGGREGKCKKGEERERGDVLRWRERWLGRERDRNGEG